MKEIIINMLTYVDDGAMIFDTRNNLIRGSSIACRIMAKWGLTVYVGYDRKKSKTETMFIPSTIILKLWRTSKNHLEGGNKGNTIVERCNNNI